MTRRDADLIFKYKLVVDTAASKGFDLSLQSRHKTDGPPDNHCVSLWKIANHGPPIIWVECAFTGDDLDSVLAFLAGLSYSAKEKK